MPVIFPLKESYVKIITTIHTSNAFGLTPAMVRDFDCEFLGVVKTHYIDEEAVGVESLYSKADKSIAKWCVKDLQDLGVLSAPHAMEYQNHQEMVMELENMGASSKNKPLTSEDIKNLITLPEISFGEIDYTSPIKKMVIDETYLYKSLSVEGRVYKEPLDKVRGVCKILKEDVAPTDVSILVPQDWVNYLGYSEDIIIRWVDFIKQLNFPFNISYEGKGSIPQHKPFGGNNFRKYYYFLQTNSYYTINIKVTEYPIINYLALLLIRYLYHTEYNNIPGLCLQLKKKTTLSNWQILLLVHAIKSYPSEYGLTTSHSNWDNKVEIVDPQSEENSERAFFKRLKQRGNLNNSFKYVYITKEYYEKIPNALSSGEIQQWMEAIPFQTIEVKVENVIPKWANIDPIDDPDDIEL